MKRGVLVIDKPQDYTSFDVIAVMRKLLSERHLGHTGTLDPMATGVLVILAGRDTKAIPYLEDAPKRYRAGFRLGVESDTLDITGTILKETPSSLKKEEVAAALAAFRGEISQIPPMYSAVSIGGKRLYDLARKGISVERRPRTVRIHELELLEFDEQKQCGVLEVSCSKGTYIRTLCADLGAALSAGAVMTSLRRLEASYCDLSMAISLDKARSLAEEGALDERLLPVETLFAAYPEAVLSEKQAQRFRNGAAQELSRIPAAQSAPDGAIFRSFAPSGEFLGLGRVRAQQGEFAVEKLFFHLPETR